MTPRRRTAVWPTGHPPQVENARALIGQIRELAAEDASWPDAFDVEIQALFLEQLLHTALGEKAQVREIGRRVGERLAAYERNHPAPAGEERTRLGTLYDNAAGALYFAGEHDLAIPLYHRTIDLGNPSPYARIWLACAIWATARDRGTVLTLLREASHRWDRPEPPWEFARTMPEFADALDDAELAQAATPPG